MPDRSTAAASPESFPTSQAVLVLAGIPIYRMGSALRFAAGMAVDADGSPRAYHPDSSSGLDFLENAGSPGKWDGIAVDEMGDPYVQTADDPCPGCFVSTTALYDKNYPVQNPRRYVDASTIPYLAVPPELVRLLRVSLGDVALVTYRTSFSPAIVADIGPAGKLGEGSISLARMLGLPASPRHGGVGAGVTYTIFVGSSKGWPRSVESIAQQVQGLRLGVA